MKVPLVNAVLLGICLVLPTAGPSFAQGLLEIQGTASYRERMTLPPDAVFEATLEDVSRVDAAGETVGQTRTEQPGNPPFRFRIQYDPVQIKPNHVYAVRAQIVEDNRVLFATSQRYEVLTQGHGSEIGMMMLHRVSGQDKQEVAAAPLRETYWKLIEIAGTPVRPTDHQREAYLIFNSQNDRVAGSGGCNRLSGTYEVSDTSMRFGGVASTRMACTTGMELESKFLSALEQVRRWKIFGRELQLTDDEGRPLLRFTALPQNRKQ